MGIEGGHAIENSLFALREFHRLGVRYMTLTHTNTNDWADSSGGFGEPGEVRHHGLSPFGEEVVKEMQRIGMLVDVSHVSDETVEDVLRIAKAPIIASHSSSRALADNPRNLTDDQLRAIGANGGVVMVNFWPLFIDPKQTEWSATFFKKHGADIKAIEEKYKADRDKAYGEITKLMLSEHPPKTPLSRLIDHIDHVAKVAGIDHVGLGSDFDGIPSTPEGLDGVDGMPRITLELLRRGYTEEQVKKILGENFLRVFAAAEDYAKATKTTLSGDGSLKRIEQR
jgi:membrane dipeptidase